MAKSASDADGLGATGAGAGVVVGAAEGVSDAGKGPGTLALRGTMEPEKKSD